MTTFVTYVFHPAAVPRAISWYEKKWVHFLGPVSGEFKVDSFIGYAALWGQARGGTPSGLGPS